MYCIMNSYNGVNYHNNLSISKNGRYCTHHNKILWVASSFIRVTYFVLSIVTFILLLYFLSVIVITQVRGTYTFTKYTCSVFCLFTTLISVYKNIKFFYCLIYSPMLHNIYNWNVCQKRVK